MNPLRAEQVPQSRTFGCLPTALGRGLPPARTLTAPIRGNRTCSIGRDHQQENPSSRPLLGIPLCDGRSYVLQKQSKDSSRYETCSVDYAKHLRTSNERTPTCSSAPGTDAVPFIPCLLQSPLAHPFAIGTNTNLHALAAVLWTLGRKAGDTHKGLAAAFADGFHHQDERIHATFVLSLICRPKGSNFTCCQRHRRVPITCKVYPITYFQNSLFFLGTNQDHQKVKSPTAAMEVGLSETSKEVISTERVGFEPTRVLPLHDFESCAINRTLPPLHTPAGVEAL